MLKLIVTQLLINILAISGGSLSRYWGVIRCVERLRQRFIELKIDSLQAIGVVFLIFHITLLLLLILCLQYKISMRWKVIFAGVFNFLPNNTFSNSFIETLWLIAFRGHIRLIRMILFLWALTTLHLLWSVIWVHNSFFYTLLLSLQMTIIEQLITYLVKINWSIFAAVLCLICSGWETWRA